jgi:hypothetical protein
VRKLFYISSRTPFLFPEKRRNAKCHPVTQTPLSSVGEGVTPG